MYVLVVPVAFYYVNVRKFYFYNLMLFYVIA